MAMKRSETLIKTARNDLKRIVKTFTIRLRPCFKNERITVTYFAILKISKIFFSRSNKDFTLGQFNIRELINKLPVDLPLIFRFCSVQVKTAYCSIKSFLRFSAFFNKLLSNVQFSYLRNSQKRQSYSILRLETNSKTCTFT